MLCVAPSLPGMRKYFCEQFLFRIKDEYVVLWYVLGGRLPSLVLTKDLEIGPGTRKNAFNFVSAMLNDSMHLVVTFY